MQTVMYLSTAELTNKTMLITYKPYFQVQHQVVFTQQDLYGLITSTMGHYSIQVLCNKEDQHNFKMWIQNKQRSKIPEVLQMEKCQQKEPNFLEQIAEQSQSNLLEKANNILSSMIKKTQSKILQCDLNWTLDKIDADIKKQQAIKQQYLAQSLTGSKKAKKYLKSAEKRLQQLCQKKKQLLSTLKQSDAKNSNKATELKSNKSQDQKSDSQLLCR